LVLGASPPPRYDSIVNDPIFQALAEAARKGESISLGIVTGAKGSSPQKVGAKAIFHADRKIQGTLGGGCLEAEAQRLALHSLKTGKPETFDLILDHDFGWDDGLICGGKVLGVVLPNAQNAGQKFWSELAERKTPQAWGVKKDFSIAKLEFTFDDACNHESNSPLTRPADTLSPSEGERDRVRGSSNARDWLYTETVTPPCALWIAGSGHIAQAAAPLALRLDFTVTIFDDRPELANHQFFPKEVLLHTGNWGELCAEPFSPAPTFGLIVTRGHKHDALVLESWIHRPFQFLGMIGSARKWRTITEHFIQKKIATAEEMARVQCPVGIKIKSQTVPEIAVSIMAQFIEQRAEMVQKK
jgi:xanthine dehydrogenase accessory factor